VRREALENRKCLETVMCEVYGNIAPPADVYRSGEL